MPHSPAVDACMGASRETPAGSTRRKSFSIFNKLRDSVRPIWPVHGPSRSRLQVRDTGRRRTAASRTRPALARRAAGRHAGRCRSRGPGRSFRERRIHLRQAAAARDRPARALPARPARRHGHRFGATDRPDARLLRRLGDESPTKPARSGATASSARTNSIRAAATSAWIRRSAAPCSASASAT